MSFALNVVYYICSLARKTGISLPKARLVKLVYLADWKSSVEYGCQITEVKWFYNHFGPYVNEIIELIDMSPYFVRRNYINQFGKPAEKIDLKDQSLENESLKIELTNQQLRIIDFVFSVTQNMGYNEFLKLVYSTYPIIKTEKYNELDLVGLAEEYKGLQR